MFMFILENILGRLTGTSNVNTTTGVLYTHEFQSSVTTREKNAKFRVTM